MSFKFSRFPIGLDFLFITFLLHFFLSWTSSLSISSSAISAYTLSNHVLGRTTGRLPSTLYSIHFFTQSSFFLITCPYHLSLPLLMTAVIGSTPTNFLNSSLVFHGNTTHPSVVVVDPHLHACLEVSFHSLKCRGIQFRFPHYDLSVRIVSFGTVAILSIRQR